MAQIAAAAVPGWWETPTIRGVLQVKIIAVDTAVIYDSIFRCRVLRSSNDGAKGKGGLG